MKTMQFTHCHCLNTILPDLLSYSSVGQCANTMPDGTSCQSAGSERNSVDCIVGLAKNKRLEAIAGHLMTGAQCKHEITDAKVRDFGGKRVA
jgi:hypothetical protein